MCDVYEYWNRIHYIRNLHCSWILLARDYMRPAGRFFSGGGMVSASLGEKNGVTSVILLPRKTVISLAAMSSLQGTIPCFITRTLTPLNRILTVITKLTLPRLRKLYAIISSTLLASFLGCNMTGVTPNFTECWWFGRQMLLASGKNAFWFEE